MKNFKKVFYGFFVLRILLSQSLPVNSVAPDQSGLSDTHQGGAVVTPSKFSPVSGEVRVKFKKGVTQPEKNQRYSEVDSEALSTYA